MFGPLPRLFDQRPPKKMVDKALKGVLSAMAAENRIHVFDDISFESGKAKDVLAFLKNAKLEKALFVVPSVYEISPSTETKLKEKKVFPKKVNKSYRAMRKMKKYFDDMKKVEEPAAPKVKTKTFRATQNLKQVRMVHPLQVNIADLLKFGNMAISEKALKTLEEALSK